MSRSRRFASIAIIALLTAAGVAVYAQSGLLAQGPGFGRGGAGGAGRGGRALGPRPGGGLPLAQLNLSQAQQDQVRQIMEQARAQNQPAAAQLRAAMEAQRRAVETLPVDDGLIRSTTPALAEAETDVAIGEARLRSDVFALLTPDQQARVKTLEAQRDSQQPPRPRPQ
jgi:Spy/CpxP family protein refolding chaperone